jgi:hypothetical protein
MSKRFFVAKAKNGYRMYFTYEGTDIPAIDVPNPMDYEIFEITEEEYQKNEKRYI